MSSKRDQDLLESLITELDELQYGDSANLDRLLRRAGMMLRGIFGVDDSYSSDLRRLNFSPMVGPASASHKSSAWNSGKDAFRNVLGTALEQLVMFGDNEDLASRRETRPTGRKVFVVHGHDAGLKETVARTLAQLELEPVILHEQENAGRTIIEKFEDHSDVSFAVVLLTPDDMGYKATDDPTTARPRARQNVILELGFFLGRLGRQRVAVLHAVGEDLEKPSDYDGVVYIPVDAGGTWKYLLVKELKAAGLDVDANKI